MFDEKLEKFFKQEKCKDMNRSQMTTIRPNYLQSQYAPPRNSVDHEKSDVIIVKK
jgi:hypothetical protein